ncbi:MAG: hypothetical protein HeimC2_21250 [Candidatus Heimdallarchaeota archaeon LC_2]|nr:MAG: hypothetical protein HeimC2_21250 [Candidatus Heimdallarchaeota archaeon LC_2]
MNHQISQDKHFQNSRVKYQLQLETSEKVSWQNHANLHHRGNLARMIRTMVNQSILRNELDEQDNLNDRIDQAIESIRESSDRTSHKVGSLEDDLMIIKSLLSKLLQTQSQFVSEYQTSISLPLEDIVYQQVFEFVESKERIVAVEEILPYLSETSLECKRYIAKEDQKLPAGGKIAVSFILGEVLKELFEKTSNPAYNIDHNNKHDFGRSTFDF